MSGRSITRPSWTPFLLGGVLTVFGGLLWYGMTAPPPAYGQIPDSGAQRVQMIAEQKATNQKLDRIIKLLTEIRDKGRNADSKDRKPAPEREP